MALPDPRTLGDVRSEVATGCNLGSQPQRAKQYQPVMDRLIRECHSHLCRLTEWDAAAGQVSDTTLIVGQKVYALPDNCRPANIDSMVVIDADGNEQEVHAGMRPNERNSAAPANGQPLRWEILSGSLYLYPSPDATWITLRIYYKASPSAMNEDGDLISCDFETLVKYAVRKTRQSLGMPLLESDGEMKEYIDQAVAAQGDGEIFHFGGKKSLHLEDQQQDRISRGLAQPSGPEWQPPGF
jgi:hypothetical protein